MTLLFYLSGLVAVVATALVITRTNAVHALLYLIVSLLAVALIFFILGAPFVAALEVIIYAGAIMVLFIFVIMLVSVERLQKQPMAGKNWKTAVVLGAVLAAEMAVFFSRGMSVLQARGTPPPAGLSGNTQQVGWALYMKYMLPFEVASVLLLVAIIGAVVFTRKAREDE